MIGMALVQMTCGKVTVRPRVLGKVATVLQMVMVLWRLLKWNESWSVVWTGWGGGADGNLGVVLCVGTGCGS